MMRSGIAGLAVAVSAGCALDVPEGDELVATGTIESAVTVLPVEGFWLYDELPPITTNCDTGVPRAESDLVLVTRISATSYRVLPGEGRPSFVCTMTDAKFTCPDRETIEIDVFGLDADLTFQVSSTGVYSDPRRGQGKQDVAVSCSGSHCGVFDPMPCGYVHNFTARAL
jgi:hypothetical protein